MCHQATQLILSSLPLQHTITFALPYIEDNERQPACISAGAAYGNSEWFKFTATATRVSLDTCTPASTNQPQIPDTVIELYSGSCPAIGLTAIGCNNDWCPGVTGCCLDSTFGPAYSGLGSRVEISGLTVGVDYYLRVGVIGWHSGTNYEFPMGDYVLTFACLDWCRGNSDCSCGSPAFLDINYFVEALVGGEPAWSSHYAVNHGGALPPCPYLINDVNGDGTVGLTDIIPFIAHLLNGSCDLMP
jgi:hypothetical protein